MRPSILILFCLLGLFANAQTSKELIGKWKLVKETKDGVFQTKLLEIRAAKRFTSIFYNRIR